MGSAPVHLGFKPRRWQAQVAADRRRFTVLACARRSGKTKLAVMLLIDAALKSKQPNSLFGFVAPFLKQARQIAWRELKLSLEPIKNLIDIHETDLSVTFRSNGARIQLFGADNADAMRGLRFDGCIVDEVAHVAPDVWHSVLQPALADREGFCLFIGTVNGIDLLFELMEVAKRDTSGVWHAATFTIFDTDALSDTEVARLQRETPPNAWAREFMCDFGASSDDQVLSIGDVEGAARRRYTERDLWGAPIILGVDPAHMGDDRSVIVQRQGLQCFEPIVFSKVSTVELATHVGDVIVACNPAAVFVDVGGVGAGVVDNLRRLGFSPTAINFGSSARRKDRFNNKRSEMIFAAADWIREGGSIPNDRDFKRELATPCYSIDAQNRRKVESKQDIKKRISAGSPDLADALALTFAAPVAATSAIREVQQGIRARNNGNYHPMESWRRGNRSPDREQQRQERYA